MRVLQVRDLHVRYGPAVAVRGVTLSVERGELVTVLGSNGAGKSSLMRAIVGLVKSDSEELMGPGGRDLSGKKTHRIVGMGVTLVPERRRILTWQTVTENLLMGAYHVRDKSLLRGRMQSVFELFPRIGERSNQIGGSLSGGEQQMLAIGRALMSDPDLLLMDEPSLGLAPSTASEMFSAIASLKGEKAILMVEQNARKALSIADRGYVMQLGSIVKEGSADDLRSDPGVVAAYLGKG